MPATWTALAKLTSLTRNTQQQQCAACRPATSSSKTPSNGQPRCQRSVQPVEPAAAYALVRLPWCFCDEGSSVPTHRVGDHLHRWSETGISSQNELKLHVVKFKSRKSHSRKIRPAPSTTDTEVQPVAMIELLPLPVGRLVCGAAITAVGATLIELVHADTIIDGAADFVGAQLTTC